MEEAMWVSEESFLALMDRMHEEEKGEHGRKSADYADREGRNILRNFDDDAAELQIPPEFDLWIFLNKHLRAIRNYCRHGSTTSEGIEGRIKDARIYLALLRAMVERKKHTDIDEVYFRHMTAEAKQKDRRAGGLNAEKMPEMKLGPLQIMEDPENISFGLGPK